MNVNVATFTVDKGLNSWTAIITSCSYHAYARLHSCANSLTKNVVSLFQVDVWSVMSAVQASYEEASYSATDWKSV